MHFKDVHVLPNLIFPTLLSSHHYRHFIGKETEVQTG